jgi:hypothetical protein
MSKLRYKDLLSDSIVDARDIIRNVGRGIEQGKIDIPSALSNLAEAMRKLEAAKSMVDKG